MAQPTDSTPTPVRRSGGAIDGLRPLLSWPSDRPFRILSIDGGGIKGVFPASLLSGLEQKLCEGRCAGDYFDLISGTSTGGIIALGLSLGIPASRILQLYQDKGHFIFPKRRGIRKFWQQVSGMWRYTYETDALEAALTEVFGDHILGDARRRLCIPSFEGTFGEVVVFKTPHHPDFRIDWQQPMVSVALATAAAPTFFKTYRSGNQVYADGGVWANNPVMIALVDALSCHDISRRQVEILSISCGDQDVPFTKGQITAGGLVQWRKIIKTAMHLASLNATGQAGLLIGRDHLVRVEPDAAAARLEMDDVEGALQLLPLAAAATLNGQATSLARFFETLAEEAPAFHGPRSVNT